jgi:hypothetical protein
MRRDGRRRAKFAAAGSGGTPIVNRALSGGGEADGLMRRAVLPIALSLALATSAGAQPKGRLTVAPAAKAGLRGSMTAQPLAADMPPMTLPRPAYGVSATAAAQDPGQCRLACAQRYYFCLAGDMADDCPSTWGQCRAACDAPSPVRGAQVPG